MLESINQNYKNIKSEFCELKSEIQKKNKIIESLQKQNLYKNSFLSCISHELKNPISAIFQISKILTNGKNILNEDFEKFLLDIKNLSKDSLDLLKDFLDIGQTETGKFSLEKTQIFDIAKLMNRCVRIAQIYSYNKKVNILQNYKENELFIECDPKRIKQIFVNLLSNAIKYNKTDGTIWVGIIKKDSNIIVSIKDNGSGIAKEELKSITEKYNIGKNKISNIDSYGIGLNVVKKLVDLHNAKIHIHSEKNKGTEVKLYFNSIEEIASDKILKPHSNNIALKAKKILLVDDDMINIKIFSRFLKKEGHQIDYANNGKEAIKKIKENSYNIIFMDGEMPIMDGYETTKKIRKFNIKTPIIALMGNSDNSVIKKAMDSGMNHFLDKEDCSYKLLEYVRTL